MKTSIRALAGALALAAAAAAAPASAALLDGQTVKVEYLFPDTNSLYEGPYDYVVGTDGARSFFNIASVTLGDTTVQADAFCGGGCSWSSAAFNGIHIFDAFNTVAAFTSVTLDASTNYAGLDASRITFDADNIWINWQGLDANGHVALNINDGASGAVPEPAAWALMIGGFGMAGATLRRRRMVAATA